MSKIYSQDFRGLFPSISCEAELAAAKAGLMAKALEVEKLKLQIARLRRMQFRSPGRASARAPGRVPRLPAG